MDNQFSHYVNTTYNWRLQLLNAEILLRKYAERDEREIIPLLRETLDDWQYRGDRSEGFWDWLYRKNPKHPSFNVVAMSNDRVIAANHTVVLSIKVGNELFIFGYGTDVVVSEDYRRRGLSGKLRGYKFKMLSEMAVNHVYAWTENPIATEMLRKVARTFPFKISRYVKIDDVDLHLSVKSSDHPWLQKIAYKFISQVTQLGAHREVDKFEISRIDGFDGGIDAFWLKVWEHYRFIVERDRVYLNWRYCDPINDYSVLVAEENREVLGYIVLGVVEKQRGYPEGYVLDLIALPGREDVADSLLYSALDHFDSEGVNSVNCLVVAGHPLEASLRRCGFVDSRKENNLFYMPIGEDDILTALGSELPSRIHFCYGDLFLL